MYARKLLLIMIVNVIFFTPKMGVTAEDYVLDTFAGNIEAKNVSVQLSSDGSAIMLRAWDIVCTHFVEEDEYYINGVVEDYTHEFVYVSLNGPSGSEPLNYGSNWWGCYPGILIAEGGSQPDFPLYYTLSMTTTSSQTGIFSGTVNSSGFPGFEPRVELTSPPYTGSFRVQEHDFGEKVVLQSLLIDPAPMTSASVRITLYGKETESSDWFLIGVGTFSPGVAEIPISGDISARIVKYGLSGTEGIRLISSTSDPTPGLLSVTLKIKPDSESPVASFKYKPHKPKTGQNVQFDARFSKPADRDGTILTYLWFFSDDGTSVEDTQPFCNHTFKKAGEWDVTLYVTDDDYLEAFTTSTVKVKPNEFMITFDDGPRPLSTPYILDQLLEIKKADESRVKAGFFLIGEDKSRATGWDYWTCGLVCPDPSVIENPLIVHRIHEEGHLIGIHTQHHPDLLELMPWDVESEILDCYDAIIDADVTPMKVFRSPYLHDPIGLPANLLGWRIIRGELTDDAAGPWVSEKDVIKKCRKIIQKSTDESPVILIFHDHRGLPDYRFNFYNIIVNELVEKDGFVLVDFEY